MFDILHEILIQIPFFSDNEAIASAIVTGLKILTVTTFIWMPPIFWVDLRNALVEFKKKECVKKMEFKTLEIKIPKNIDKSPLAMEIVLQAMHQPFKPQNYYDQIFAGKVNSWFSLEMISTEGAIRFIIYTPKDYVKLITSHIYSQYPNVEINEIEDYVKKVPFGRDSEEWDLFGTEFKLTKADPYPIKTYVDYGLDKLDLKEEYKIDPMTVVLEYLGSIGRNQHAWFQILIRAHESRYKGTPKPRDWKKFWKELYWKINTKEWWAFMTNDWWTPPLQDWKKEADKLIGEIKAKTGDKPMSAIQKKEVEAMERSMTKLGFDVGIRAVYVAKKDFYDSANIAGLNSILKQYSSLELNGFEANAKKSTKTDPKKDKTGDELKKLKKNMFESYLKRSYFYFQKNEPFVLNTEELATIYHFPGKVSSTPTFTRIESQKAEPPSNLPI